MATPVKGPNAKPYIVAALTATIAVAAVITIFFIVLSPARVDFSVTHAGSHQLEDGSVELALTLAANNTSRRAAVVYESMFVDVKNHTNPKFVYSVEASLATGMPLVQPRLSVENISATVNLVGGTGWVEEYTSDMTNDHFSVVVATWVRFKVASARTRPYNIMVTCAPVKFFNAVGSKRSGGAAARLQQPVKCI